ncbi:hypothetical protein [Terribacillus saccharophilus]|uniref:hypothetical protein n=1 Tax=Terribacillus saccharophilus TaxID=361277 RepID=UPI002989CAA9|nr:hypothetical protein [Terribacillus saccharophilus]MCM3226535.1 hypothetical protein [Terribacillus saccharophilus]
MKLKVSIFFSLFCLTFFVANTVFAAEDETTTKTLGNDVTVEVYEDGRVKPIEDVKNLSEESVDLILKEIGYKSSYIAAETFKKKEELVKLGGKIVEAEVEMKKEYVSSDGRTYEINPTTKEQVREKQINDLKDLGVREKDIENYDIEEKNQMTLMNCSTIFEGMCGQDNWTGTVMVLKHGETSSSYIYRFIVEYSWQGTTRVNFKDSIAVQWGGYGQPVANSQKFIQSTMRNNNESRTDLSSSVDVSNTNGVKTSFFLEPTNSTADWQTGGLSQDVYIDKSNRNKDLTASAMYTHPFVPGAGSISIGYAGLSVSWGSNIGNVWSWQLNFNPF